MSKDRHAFTTRARSLVSTGELRWGGDGHPWDAELDESSGVLFENGVIRPGRTIPGNVIDNFQQYTGDPAGPYEEGRSLSDYYKGKLSSYTIVEQSHVLGGSRALSYDIDNGSDEKIVSEPGDGLPRYPEKGDTVSRLQRGHSTTGSGQGSADLLLLNGAYDAGSTTIDGYGFGLDFGASDIVIWRFENAPIDTNEGRRELARSAVPLSDNAWYWTEVDLPDDTGAMSVRAYEVDETSLEKGTQIGSESITNTTISPDNRGVGMVGRRRGEPGEANYARIQIGPAGGQ